MRWNGWAVAAIVLLATLTRLINLGATPFWVDEAESCINAFTILDTGLPLDHYQGQPIFENALSRPWPDHPEYEFKDSSYSDRGVAIYHGWLPLYSIALSFKAFGIKPDPIPDQMVVRHSDQANRLRTFAGRLPMVRPAISCSGVAARKYSMKPGCSRTSCR